MSGGDQPLEPTKLLFEKFAAFIKTPFWFELKKKKINEYRLSADEVEIWGVYSTPRGSGEVGKMELNKESFDEEFNAGPLEACVRGTLLNYNTIEEYKKMDHKAVLAEKAEKLWDAIRSGEWLGDPTVLVRFCMYSFSDLKGFVFRGRGAMPTLSPKTAIVGRIEDAESKLGKGILGKVKEQLDVKRGIVGGAGVSAEGFKNAVFFIVELQPDGGVAVAPLSSLQPSDTAAISSGSKIIAFFDPCTNPSHVGWPARNLLLAISHTFNPTSITLLSYREQLGNPTPSKVVTCYVEHPPSAPYTEWATAVGWEEARPPANLSKLMDSELLAGESANLNLSLMKWRMLPNLDLDKIAAQKCLLVGSGTLGCGVARNLMKWGIFNFTMIDRGNVSYSNTVRQSLFVHEDAVLQKNKAQAAADACKRIYPLCNVKAVDMSVPMPGHIVDGAAVKEVKAVCEKFDKLVEEHDVVFLLTDSRESRWLPSVIGARHGKIVINAALGFESYLAMRHGVRNGPEDAKMLGCYFCNDITSPCDSLSDRTLDQQCTVTRPGVSDIASSLAVELLVSLISHPLGPHAPPTGSPQASTGALGTVPHQIRGGLYSFEQQLIRGEAFPQCTACSEKIVEAYKTEGFDFILKALNSPNCLGDISGITELLKPSNDLEVESCSDFEDEEG